MNNVDDIKERIKFLMVQKGLNQRELAEKIGITTPAVNKWFAKGSIPKLGGTLEKLAMALDTTPSFLLFGEARIEESVKLDDGYVLIPNYEVRGSCGPGCEGVQTRPPVKFMKVATEWLRIQAPYANFSALNIITAEGDSMLPTFRDGDLVLIDTSQKTFRSDSVYAFVKDNDIYIKRIQRIGNGIRVISDNSDLYKPFEITGSDLETVKIIGRAYCIGKFQNI